MTWRRRIAVPMVVTFVVGYLAVMVLSGEQPTQRQLVEFEAKGVLKIPPEQVRRVELVRADQHIALLRQDEDKLGHAGWRRDRRRRGQTDQCGGSDDA
jgi:hypothetical protein